MTLHSGWTKNPPRCSVCAQHHEGIVRKFRLKDPQDPPTMDVQSLHVHQRKVFSPPRKRPLEISEELLRASGSTGVGRFFAWLVDPESILRVGLGTGAWAGSEIYGPKWTWSHKKDPSWDFSHVRLSHENVKTAQFTGTAIVWLFVARIESDNQDIIFQTSSCLDNRLPRSLTPWHYHGEPSRTLNSQVSVDM